jgi:antitoxin (DNA-binding transcriptional repressor) of toxin-antitoxin stability system
MTKATFTEFRKHAKSYFDSVEKGATIQVSRHGKIIAEVAPPRKKTGSKSWKKPGLKLLVPGVSLAQAVLEQRKESRA